MSLYESRKNRVPLLIIEGNIGSGKSTFLRLIASSLNTQLVYEPLHKWQNINGHNLLDYFYKDTQRWAYTFQAYAFITRIVEQQEYAKVNNKPLQMVERSIYSDHYCFAKNCHEMGFMSGLEWALYEEWFGWLSQTQAAQPDAFIYLRTEPKTCFARLQKRNRSEENNISLDYLELLHQKHEDWLIHKKNVNESMRQTPVLVLSCDEDFEKSYDKQQQHLATITDFLQEKFNIPKHVAYNKSVTIEV